MLPGRQSVGGRRRDEQRGEKAGRSVVENGRSTTFLVWAMALAGCHSPEAKVGSKDAPCARAYRELMARQPPTRARVAIRHNEAEWAERTRSLVFIPREEAVRLAESWLAAQGFTDAPPATDVRLSPDIVDVGSDAEIFSRRHDTVAPHAVAAMKKHGWWTIAFPYRHPSPNRDSATGRGVRVRYDGKVVRMEHQSVCIPLFVD